MTLLLSRQSSLLSPPLLSIVVVIGIAVNCLRRCRQHCRRRWRRRRRRWQRRSESRQVEKLMRLESHTCLAFRAVVTPADQPAAIPVNPFQSILTEPVDPLFLSRSLFSFVSLLLFLKLTCLVVGILPGYLRCTTWVVSIPLFLTSTHSHIQTHAHTIYQTHTHCLSLSSSILQITLHTQTLLSLMKAHNHIFLSLSFYHILLGSSKHSLTTAFSHTHS